MCHCIRWNSRYAQVALPFLASQCNAILAIDIATIAIHSHQPLAEKLLH